MIEGLTKVKEVSVGKYTFTYQEHNDGGERILLFLHGWCSFQYFWNCIIEEFYPYGTCITFDLLGHYPATVPPTFSEFTQDSLFKLQKEAIAKAFSGKKVTIIGHSAGGFVGIGIAALFPEIVDKVIAICPPVTGPMKGLLYPAKLANDFKLDFINYSTLEVVKFFPALIETWFSQGSGNPSTFLEIPGVREFVRSCHPHYKNLNTKTMNVFLKSLDRMDLLPLMDIYDVPTLLLSGKKDELIFPDQTVSLLERNSNFQVSWYEESGHIPMMEEKEKFIKDIKDFLSV